MSQGSLRNQLIEVYKLLCRSAMNREYYGERLSQVQRSNELMEILIAIGTTGSGISGITLWEVKPYGPWVWATLTITSALLAVAKPIIQLNKKVERLSKLYAGHSNNYATLIVLASRIRWTEEISSDMRTMYEAAEGRFLELSIDDDPRPDRKLQSVCEDIVRQRHPEDSFWFPSPEKVSSGSD